MHDEISCPCTSPHVFGLYLIQRRDGTDGPWLYGCAHGFALFFCGRDITEYEAFVGERPIPLPLIARTGPVSLQRLAWWASDIAADSSPVWAFSLLQEQSEQQDLFTRG